MYSSFDGRHTPAQAPRDEETGPGAGSVTNFQKWLQAEPRRSWSASYGNALLALACGDLSEASRYARGLLDRSGSCSPESTYENEAQQLLDAIAFLNSSRLPDTLRTGAPGMPDLKTVAVPSPYQTPDIGAWLVPRLIASATAAQLATSIRQHPSRLGAIVALLYANGERDNGKQLFDKWANQHIDFHLVTEAVAAATKRFPAMTRSHERKLFCLDALAYGNRARSIGDEGLQLLYGAALAAALDDHDVEAADTLFRDITARKLDQRFGSPHPILMLMCGNHSLIAGELEDAKAYFSWVAIQDARAPDSTLALFNLGPQSALGIARVSLWQGHVDEANRWLDKAHAAITLLERSQDQTRFRSLRGHELLLRAECGAIKVRQLLDAPQRDDGEISKTLTTATERFSHAYGLLQSSGIPTQALCAYVDLTLIHAELLKDTSVQYEMDKDLRGDIATSEQWLDLLLRLSNDRSPIAALLGRQLAATYTLIGDSEGSTRVEGKIMALSLAMDNAGIRYPNLNS